ncbi:MAG TPA: 3-deoxy-7-phosphoheptulonate synthase, partial [Thermoanaerobaculia bacterium]|nr:3-deoxy-7-phosphoheptulonate synthase [Thermoanaerobaculia bacterium]
MTPSTSLEPGRGDWRPDSWQRRPALQQPLYPDPAAVDRVVDELSQLPPLVTSWEVEELKAQ